MSEASDVSAGVEGTCPFPLSIHASGMLESGIRKYVEDTAALYEAGSEDARSCVTRTFVAQAACDQLQAWVAAVDSGYLRYTIKEMRRIRKQLKAERRRYGRLALAKAEADRREESRGRSPRRSE